MLVDLDGRSISRSAPYQEGDTFRSFVGVVRATVPTKVAPLPYLDLVAAVRNGGSRV